MGAQAIDLDLPALEGAVRLRPRDDRRTARRCRRCRRAVRRRARRADHRPGGGARQSAPLLVSARDGRGRWGLGSVVVDLAAESGRQRRGRRGRRGRAHRQRAGLGRAQRRRADARPGVAAYAQNVVALITLTVRRRSVAPDLDDEIPAGCCPTAAASISHELTRLLVRGA